MAGASMNDRDVDIDLGRLFAVLRERARTIVLAVVAAGVLAFAMTTVMTPLFKAETRILIDSRNGLSGASDSAQNGQTPLLDPRGVSSQVEVVRSTDLIKKVAAKLDLSGRAEFEGGNPSIFSRLMTLAGLKSEPRSAPEERMLTAFRKKLSVYQVENSRVIVIQFSSEDPELSAAVPNAMANAYLARQSGIKLEDNSDAAAWLRPEIDRLRDQVRDSEAKVADYRSKSDLLMVGQNDTLADRELSDAAQELGRVRAERADAEAKAADVRDALKSGRSIDTLTDVVGSPLIQQLRQREVAIQGQLADLSTTLLDRHPRIRALRSQLGELNRRIDTESRKVLASLENEADVARRREQQLTNQMNTLKAKSAEAGEQQVQLQALQRQAAADRDLLNTYLARFGEATSRNNASALPADARVISQATVPARSYYPKTGPIVIVAMVATFLIACIGIMLAELFSGRALRPVGDVQTAPVSPAIAAEPANQRGLPDVATVDAGYEPPLRAAPSRAGKETPVIAEVAARDASDWPTHHADQDERPLGDPEPAGLETSEKADEAVGASDFGSVERHESEDASPRTSPAAVPFAVEAAADPESEPSDEANGDEADSQGESAAVVDETDESNDFSIAAAAVHLMNVDASTVVCVSPEGDEGSAASVILARLLAEQGRRTILIDMTGSACPTRLMANSSQMEGVTDLLAGETAFADTIHADEGSPAHLIPQGAADPELAMRGADRLPMIIDALKEAYDMVIVECGPANVAGVERLMRDGEAQVVLTVVHPEDDAVSEALSQFYDAGYEKLIVMMPDLGPPADRDSYAA